MSTYSSQNTSDSEGGASHSPKNGTGKVDVFISPSTSPVTELRRIKRLGKTTEELQIHVDPSHQFGDLPYFLQLLVPLVPFVSKIRIGLDDVTSGQGDTTAEWPLFLVTLLLRSLNQRDPRIHPPIVCVKLCTLTLVGCYWDFLNLSEIVREMTCLERFNMDNVTLRDLTPRSVVPSDAPLGCWLVPLMQVLATLPRLKHLRLLGASDFGFMNTITTRNPSGQEPLEEVIVPNQTLRQLCASTCLQSLCLIYFNLSDDNVTHMAQQLSSNHTLRELDIECSLSVGGAQALVSLMVGPNQTLEDFNVCIRNELDKNDEETLGAEEKINHILADGVRQSTLFNFALFRSRIGKSCHDSFRKLMAQQYTLESMTLYTGDLELNKAFAADPVINFHCKLNRNGRAQLITGKPSMKRKNAVGRKKSLPTPTFPTPELCLVEILGRVSDDLSCLFYVLSVNPCICDRALAKIMRCENSERSKNVKFKKRNAKGFGSTQQSKRTRLYRAAKYERRKY